MKTAQPENIRDAFAWQYRQWFGLNTPQSYAAVDAVTCAMLGSFSFFFQLPLFWTLSGSLFLVGAAVRARHVWMLRTDNQRTDK